MSTRSKRKNTNTKKSEIALDVRNYSFNYSGLEVSKSDLPGSSQEEICGTIRITDWVRPDGSDMTLLRLDFPEMGCVSYREGPL